MRINRKGQSVLEYAMLATIIFVGLIIGGPFLIKAVEAHFKLNEDSVKDSMSEQITQKPLVGAGAACACSIGTPDLPTDPKQAMTVVNTWPTTSCGAGPCKDTQRYHYRTCTPMKCAQEEGCVPEPACCTPVVAGNCGTRIPDRSDPVRSMSKIPANKEPRECTSRAPVNTHFQGAYVGTCVQVMPDGSLKDTHDCAMGERLYQTNCGRFPSPGDPDQSETATFFACLSVPSVECLPICYQDPFPRSQSCNKDAGGNSLEKDNPANIAERTALIDEVIRRKSVDNINVSDSGDIDHDGDTSEILYPYRVWSVSTSPANYAGSNVFQNHFTYLKQGNCDKANDGSTMDRFCERTCPAGYAPNKEGENGLTSNESCNQTACWYGYWPLDVNDAPVNNQTKPAQKKCSTQEEPEICAPNTGICGYLVICSNKTTGNITPYYTNCVTSIRGLADINQSCADDERKLAQNNKAYCYKVDMSLQTTPIAIPGSIHCDDQDMYYTVFGCEN